MGRKATPQPLAISPTSLENENANDIFPGPKSAPSVTSQALPRSPFRFSTKLGQGFGEHSSSRMNEEQDSRRNISSSPTTPSQPIFQQPLASEKQEGRNQVRRVEESRPSTSPAKGGFFANYKATKSANRLQQRENTRPGEGDKMSRDTALPGDSMNASVPDQKRRDPSTTRRPVAITNRSDLSSTNGSDSDAGAPTAQNNMQIATPPPTAKRAKPKPFSLLRRPSIRVDGASPIENQPVIHQDIDRPHTSGLKTAPLRVDQDRHFRDIMGSSGMGRNRSADRQPHTARELPKDYKQERGAPTPRDYGGQSFLGNVKNSSTKAFNIGRGFLNKVGRSGSTNEREIAVDDEHYVLKVINLPLVEQTRLTRISKRLENSRDKTEFWMPAFPWRAIDYLNYKGTETEGLYRVPGSGPQIKKWQRRFDEEHDIDLFEQDDLYDINIIGSMLKAWLRELPDELLPKAAQERIATQMVTNEEVSQVLIDELSNLPPFNYYLLFAITCHLSLLLAHSAKNKMDFRNLCICFQPCMKIDAFCFKLLVVNWRDCWKGCKTEEEWVKREYAEMAIPLDFTTVDGRSSTAVEFHDERAISSSDSSKPPSVGLNNAGRSKSPSAQAGGGQSLNGSAPTQNGSAHNEQPATPRSRPQNMAVSQSIGSLALSSDMSSTPSTTVAAREDTPSNMSSITLSPIQPLSPMTL